MVCLALLFMFYHYLSGLCADVFLSPYLFIDIYYEKTTIVFDIVNNLIDYT